MKKLIFTLVLVCLYACVYAQGKFLSHKKKLKFEFIIFRDYQLILKKSTFDFDEQLIPKRDTLIKFFVDVNINVRKEKDGYLREYISSVYLSDLLRQDKFLDDFSIEVVPEIENRQDQDLSKKSFIVILKLTKKGNIVLEKRKQEEEEKNTVIKHQEGNISMQTPLFIEGKTIFENKNTPRSLKFQFPKIKQISCISFGKYVDGTNKEIKIGLSNILIRK